MVKSDSALGEAGLSAQDQLIALDSPRDVEPMSTADVNLRSLHRALRRTRAILYTAMMDGTIKKTLWANTREDLLAYLDRVIEVALDVEDAEVASAGTRAGLPPLSVSDLVAAPSELYARYLAEQ